MIKTERSVLVGIAIYEGRIGSIEDCVIDYIPHEEISDINWYKLKIKHALSKTTGLVWPGSHEPIPALAEETGAAEAEIKAVEAYGVEKNGQRSYGMLFFANMHNLGVLPEDSEIGEVQLFDTLPENLTYPDIQPHLYHRIQEWIDVL